MLITTWSRAVYLVKVAWNVEYTYYARKKKKKKDRIARGIELVSTMRLIRMDFIYEIIDNWEISAWYLQSYALLDDDWTREGEEALRPVYMDVHFVRRNWEGGGRKRGASKKGTSFEDF